MQQFVLPRGLVNQILQQAQAHEEVEICGLIGGIDGLPQTLYPVPNVASDQARVYQMDPAKQIEAMRMMREKGEEFLAIYHSHPSASAEPSLKDILEAEYKDVVYLIVSLNTEGVLEMRAFLIENGGSAELMLSME